MKIRWRQYLLLLGGIAVLFMSLAYSGRFTPDYGDSDTYTRIAYLMQVGWDGILNPVFSRDAAPEGLILEWTLPFNAISMLLLTAGQYYATMFSGGIFILLLCIAAGCCSRLLGSKKAWCYTVLLASFQSILTAYGQPGRLNHHNATAAMFMYALMFCLMWWKKPTRIKAFMAGAFCTILLWESMEAVPAYFICLGVIATAILQYPKRYAGGASVFALGGIASCGFALWIDGPWPIFNSFSPYRLSLFHFMIIASSGLSLMILESLRGSMMLPYGTIERLRFLIRITPALIPLIIIPLLVIMVRQTEFSHFYMTYFWNSIGELNGLWGAPQLVLTALGSSLLVFLSWLGMMNIKASSFMRFFLVSSLGCSIILSCIWIRMAVYPEALTILLGSMMVSHVFDKVLPASAQHKNSFILGLDGSRPQIFALLFCFAVSAATFFRPIEPVEHPCEAKPDFSAWLENELPKKAIVLADIWPTPSLLKNTHALRTVAGPYHGNPNGVSDVAEFMSSVPDISISVFEKRNADAVMLCGYSDKRTNNPLWPAGSTADLLASGKELTWLAPMSVPSQFKTDLMVWRRTITSPHHSTP